MCRVIPFSGAPPQLLEIDPGKKISPASTEALSLGDLLLASADVPDLDKPPVELDATRNLFVIDRLSRAGASKRSAISFLAAWTQRRADIRIFRRSIWRRGGSALSPLIA